MPSDRARADAFDAPHISQLVLSLELLKVHVGHAQPRAEDTLEGGGGASSSFLLRKSSIAKLVRSAN